MSIEQDPALSPEGVSDDATTVTDPQVTEEAAESPEESGEGAGAGAPQDDKEQAPEIEIVVDGEEPPPQKEAAPQWVKDLRKENRELKAREAELRRQLQAGPASEMPADLGPKPTLEDCDFDANVFEAKLETWHEAKRRKDASDAQAAEQATAQQRAWQSRLDAYGKARDELSKQLPDYADAEAVTKSALDITQQGVLLHCADNAALVVAALGQSPNLLKELAGEKDPIRFAAKVAKLEVRLKMKPKNQPPPPEKPITGSGSTSGSGDSLLRQLEADADRTGDRTKLLEYKKRQRSK